MTYEIVIVELLMDVALKVPVTVRAAATGSTRY